MDHDAWFFVGIFVFIFLVWIATGGPTHPISFTGPTLSEPAELGGGSYLSFPHAPFSVGDGSYISLPGSSSGDSSDSYGNQSSSVVGNGVLFGDSSPYRNLVWMNHYVSSPGASNPNNESIQIGVSQSANVPVDLSGWSVVSEATGNTAVIPKGTQVPESGIINAAQDIVLNPGEHALVISGNSPIGASFEENRCIGYFSSFQNFSPSLPQNCPSASDDLAKYYGGDYVRDPVCIDYVNKLSRCEAVLTPPVTASGLCQNFVVNHLNYNGCVAAHKSDTDFEDGVWRIYLGRSTSAWRSSHEVIKLLDANGKTVDAFSY